MSNSTSGRCWRPAIIFETLPLTRASEAHQHLESGQVVGKILLVPDG
jgi:hypothetical protein